MIHAIKAEGERPLQAKPDHETTKATPIFANRCGPLRYFSGESR
jgi:hypothetical protein